MERLTYMVSDGAVIGRNEAGDKFTRTVAGLREWGMKSIAELEAWLLKHGYTRMPADATEQAEIDAAKCQPAHVSHVEPERAPLEHFGKRTPFDSFKGWEAPICGGEDYISPLQGSPLQRMNEGGNALCGSAWLLVR
jgi:hypothetical protein